MQTLPGEDDRQAVSQTLDRLRSGVRQRQAELSTVGADGGDLRLRLAELQSSEFLQEPACVSPRPVIGPLLVWVRKAFFHLFVKWYVRPIVAQQNRFNSSAGSLVRDLADAHRDLGEENRKLRRRVDELETAVVARDE
jgi:hypothetical protein